MRRRAATALLVFVALWPLVTLGLQAGWDVDPWKLMSFGMYAAPGRRLEDVRLSLSVKRDGVWQVAAAEEAEDFVYWRRTLGRLVPAADLARALLESTNADEARVEVRSIRLDPSTARVVWDRDAAEAKKR